MSWLRRIFSSARPHDGFRFAVWDHSKDRRTPALRAREAALEDIRAVQRQQLAGHHDQHVRDYHAHQCARYVNNVIEFPRRATGGRS